MEYFSWFVCVCCTSVCVSSSNVFHVFWLHVLPNYCNLIRKQEWPNPLLYCRNPASETLVINLACFNRDWESSAVTAEGRPPWEAPLFPRMLIRARRQRRQLAESWMKLWREESRNPSFSHVLVSVSWLSPERYRLCVDVCVCVSECMCV